MGDAGLLAAWQKAPTEVARRNCRGRYVSLKFRLSIVAFYILTFSVGWGVTENDESADVLKTVKV